MFTCPECHNTLTYLEYSEDNHAYFNAYGKYTDENWEETGRDYTDDGDGEFMYACPECEYETHNVDDFEPQRARQETKVLSKELLKNTIL